MRQFLSIWSIVFMVLGCSCGQTSQRNTDETTVYPPSASPSSEVELDDPLADQNVPSEMNNEPRFELDPKSIVFMGVRLKDTKENLLRLLGPPHSLNRLHYDCGPFSEEWQGTAFYQYAYYSSEFIVYDSLAEIAQIVFSDTTVLEINGVALNSSLSKSDVLRLLSQKEEPDHSDDNRLLIYPANGDDGYYILEFDESSLHRFTRFDPC